MIAHRRTPVPTGVRRWSTLATTACVVAMVSAAPASAQSSLPTAIDVGPSGEAAEHGGLVPSVSRGGRFVAFSSSAGNLVPGDTNGPYDGGRDVFVRDIQEGTTVRVSVTTGGGQASGESDTPSISADGRFLAFWSAAPDLAPRDTNGDADVFVHDRLLGKTTRVSVASTGAQLSGGAGTYPRISGDGRYVAFESSSPDVVPGYAPRSSAVYVHDRRAHRTTLVSPRAWGTRAASGSPSISDDGRRVAFMASIRPWAWSDDLRIYVHDRTTGRTTRLDVDPSGRPADGASREPVISGDGRYVAFSSNAGNLVSGDVNRGVDVFVRDLRKRQTTRASIRPNGTPLRRCPRDDAEPTIAFPCGASPAISRSGRFVVFGSESRGFDTTRAGNGRGIFVRDLRSRRTIPVATGRSIEIEHPAISGNGHIVVYRNWPDLATGALFWARVR